jgi:iron(III) transport system ATP-binding protein
MTDALRLRGVARAFGAGPAAVPVLCGIDLCVQRGSLVALLGPSGCGKTTLLRLVAGFDRPDAGTIEVDGRVVAGNGVHVPPERRRIGVVPQEGAVFPHLSVLANVAFGLGRAARRGDRARGVLDLVGLGGLADRMPHELSGGQLQRVALARALAPEPSVVLLDEPFAALDTSLRAAMRDEVRRVVDAAGATALLVTHDQEEALSMADQVAIMVDGQIAQQDSPMAVYRRPASETVAAFLGDAVWLAAHSDGTWARTPLGVLPTTGPAPAGRGRVLVRPEQLRLDPPGGAGLPGLVRHAQFFGHDALVSVQVGDGDDAVGVTARLLGAPTHLGEGAPVTVSVSGAVPYFPEPAPDALPAATMER